jgi:hypothetical protein
MQWDTSSWKIVTGILNFYFCDMCMYNVYMMLCGIFLWGDLRCRIWSSSGGRKARSFRAHNTLIVEWMMVKVSEWRNGGVNELREKGIVPTNKQRTWKFDSCCCRWRGQLELRWGSIERTMTNISFDPVCVANWPTQTAETQPEECRCRIMPKISTSSCGH